MATHFKPAEADVQQNAEAILSQHGDNAFTYAVEQAHQSRSSGDRIGSKTWAAIAWAINDITSTPARA